MTEKDVAEATVVLLYIGDDLGANPVAAEDRDPKAGHGVQWSVVSGRWSVVRRRSVESTLSIVARTHLTLTRPDDHGY